MTGSGVWRISVPFFDNSQKDEIEINFLTSTKAYQNHSQNQYCEDIIHVYSYIHDSLVARADFDAAKMEGETGWWWFECPHKILKKQNMILTPLGMISYFQYLWQIEKNVNILELPSQLATAIIYMRQCENQLEYWNSKRITEKMKEK